MKVLTFANPKGGAGKTVSAVNFAYGIHREGKKVLLIDTDPRGGVTTSLQLEKRKTLMSFLEEHVNGFVNNLDEYIINKNGVDILQSSYELSRFESFFGSDIITQSFIVKEILEEYFYDYDYVIIDMEGTINNLTSSILNSCNFVFIPTQPSNLDLTGVRDILSLIDRVKMQNKELEIKKVFLVRAKHHTNAFKNFQNELTDFFDENIFSNISIRENQDIVNAVNLGVDIFTYKNYANASIDYRNLVEEFLEEERITDGN